MSVVVSSLRARVLSKLKSRGKSFDPVEVDQEIRDQYLAMKQRLPQDFSYTPSAGTISALAESFTLPTTSSAEYGGEIRIRLRSTNQFLVKVSRDELEAMKDGSTLTSGSRSRRFAPVEGADQSVTCYVWPLNAEAEVYDLFRTQVAADFSATDIAGTVLAISRYGQEALIQKVSAALLMAMDGDDAKARKLNQRVADKWDMDGEKGIVREEARLHDIAAIGRIQRFVA